MKIPRNILLLVPLVFMLAGCCAKEQWPPGDRPGSHFGPRDYFIGRRVYKKGCKFWGYVLAPGQLSWNAAQLVVLDEQLKLAPDRAIDKIGSDNNYEYKLFGHFSGETVYDPACNSFYPVFVLTGYQLISTSPAPVPHRFDLPQHKAQ